MTDNTHEVDNEQIVQELRATKVTVYLAVSLVSLVLVAQGAMALAVLEALGQVELAGVLVWTAVVVGGYLVAGVTIAKVNAASGKTTLWVRLARRVPGWKDPLEYDSEVIDDIRAMESDSR